MKKLLIIFSAGIIGILTSCNSKKDGGGGMSDLARKNLESSHIVRDAMMSGDISKIDDAIAADFVDHTDRGDMGRDSTKAMIANMKKMMGDMKMTLMKELADDEYVFSELEFTGTRKGEMGMPDGPYVAHGIEVVKFKDGKAIEHWEYMRNDDVMKMMKMMMPPPPAKDTTKHN